MTKTQKKLWIGLLIMALLSPVGIVLPAKFKSGDAWGEWSAETLSKLLGYMPEGLRKYAEFWKAPVKDYNFGGAHASMTVQAISYIISGVLGVLAVGLIIYLISRLMVKSEK